MMTGTQAKRQRHAETPCQKADPNDRKITCGSPRGHIGPCQWARARQIDWKAMAANDRDDVSAKQWGEITGRQ